MSTRVCLSANTIGYPEGGGHAWVYLNWALGLRDAGAEVIWLEGVNPRNSIEKIHAQAQILRARLAPFGLDQSLVLFRSKDGIEDPVPGYPGLDAASEADLLLNFQYGLSPTVLNRFRRTALVDIDPGMTQIWISRDEVKLSSHDLYFTIGETVGQPGSNVPDVGVNWHYTPPVASLAQWPVVRAEEDAPFTAVSQWNTHEWMADLNGEWYLNDKRTGYLPFFDLPKLTRQKLELAICIDPDEPDREDLVSRGWCVRHSTEVSSTTNAYRSYIQSSRGEFGCAKPSYVKLAGAWISDRTLCYLASGKPAVVQNTGPSRFLPDRSGILRFNNPTQAAECLELAAGEYDRHCRAARALAEEFFDARKNALKVLEISL